MSPEIEQLFEALFIALLNSDEISREARLETYAECLTHFELIRRKQAHRGHAAG